MGNIYKEKFNNLISSKKTQTMNFLLSMRLRLKIKAGLI